MLTAACLGELVAFSVEIQGVMFDLELQDVLCHFLNLLNPWVAKFKYPLTVSADQVIVLFVFVGLFKLGQVLSELVFGDKAAIEKKFDGVVKGGATDTVFFILHVDV